MDTDLALTLGLVLAALSLPSFLAAWVEGRLPRLGAAFVLLAGGAIGWAITQSPQGYALQDIPDVVLRVLARVIN